MVDRPGAGLRTEVVAAIHATADALVADTNWLELPEHAWLPERAQHRPRTGYATISAMRDGRSDAEWVEHPPQRADSATR